jgi:hypothetical protein
MSQFEISTKCRHTIGNNFLMDQNQKPVDHLVKDKNENETEKVFKKGFSFFFRIFNTGSGSEVSVFSVSAAFVTIRICNFM